MKHSILYYPSINIKDGIWLRNALLYWDEVCTIVPFKWEKPSFSDDLKWLKDNGVYRPIMVSRSNKIFDSTAFKTDVMKYLKQQFVTDVKIKMIDSEQMIDFIHYEKIPQDIAKLFNTKNAKKVEGYYGLPQSVVNIYMGILAKHLAAAEKNDTVIGTDQNKFMTLPYGKEWYTPKNICMDILFEKALPMPADNVSYEDILRFKEEHRTALLHFRKKIRTFKRNISASESNEEIKSTLADFQDELECNVKNITEAMKSCKMEFYLGTIKTILACETPALLNMILNHEQIPRWLVGCTLATGGVFGVGRCYINKKKEQYELMNKNEFSYLVQGVNSGIVRGSGFKQLI